MTPPAPRSGVARPWLALVVLAAAATTLVAACAPGSPDGLHAAKHAAVPVEAKPPSPTETRDLAWYLNALPQFDPAPAPEPVWLSRYEGQAAFTPEVPTTAPVAFLTIDDGAVRHPMALELIRAAKVPVTLFVTTNYVPGNESWFTALRDTGYVTIQNHSVSHPNLVDGGYRVARDELCDASDGIASWFGQRPTLFRPPYGEYDDDTLRAAWECGLQAGFHWRETVDGGTVTYQRDAGHIHAGDIILMHFRPDFPDDFLAALQAIKNSGLIPARLEDYVRVGEGLPPPTEPTPTRTRGNGHGRGGGGDRP